MSESSSQLDDFLYESIRSALEKTPSAEAPDIYVASLLVYDSEDDPRRPTITVGYNTERAAQEAMAGLHPASTADEARWNYAFFLQNELSVIGDPESDPDGASLVETWAKEKGYWYSDAEEEEDFDETEERVAGLTRDFVGLAVKAVRRLHEGGEVERVFGRAIPVLIHELEYYDEIGEQNLDANPPGVADEFAHWCASL
jgi:hypothetical protein